MSLSMRRAETSDVEALCRLMEELNGQAISPEQMMNRLLFVEESKFDSLFLCEEYGKTVGLLGFRIRENLEEVSRFGEVSAVVVNRDDRREGVGRFMMEYAEKMSKEAGCKGTWLVSGFGREEESHAFYQQLGYQVNGYRFIKLFE